MTTADARSHRARTAPTSRPEPPSPDPTAPDPTAPERSSPAPSQTPSQGPRPRLPYLDVARGLCVLAVVLVHVGYFHVFPLAGDPAGRPLLKTWEVFNSEMLSEVRMPLLLLVSGWLAGSKIRAGLGSSKTRWAVLGNVHLVIVWTILYALVERLVAPGPALTATSAAESVPAVLREIVHPTFGPLWFVHLLAITTVFLCLTRRLPPALVLGALLLVGWAVSWRTGDPAGLPRAVFFAVGFFIGPKVPTLIGSRRVLLGAGVATVVLGAAAALLSPPLRYPVEVAACIPVCVLVLALAAWATRTRALHLVTTPLAWVGRRTLGVYVLHWPLIGLLTVFGATHRADFAVLRRSTLVDVVYPVALTVLIAAACVLAEAGLRRARLSILFEPPPVLRRLVESRSAAGSPARVTSAVA